MSPGCPAGEDVGRNKWEPTPGQGLRAGLADSHGQLQDQPEHWSRGSRPGNQETEHLSTVYHLLVRLDSGHRSSKAIYHCWAQDRQPRAKEIPLHLQDGGGGIGCQGQLKVTFGAGWALTTWVDLGSLVSQWHQALATHDNTLKCWSHRCQCD